MHIKIKYHLILVLYLMVLQHPNCLITLIFNKSLAHIAYFDNTIVLLLFVFATLGFMFSVFFPHFKQYDYILMRCEESSVH